MTADQKLAIEREYDALFPGLDDLSIPELTREDRFWDMVGSAVARRSPLTRPELDAAFPSIAWEY